MTSYDRLSNGTEEKSENVLWGKCLWAVVESKDCGWEKGHCQINLTGQISSR